MTKRQQLEMDRGQDGSDSVHPLHNVSSDRSLTVYPRGDGQLVVETETLGHLTPRRTHGTDEGRTDAKLPDRPSVHGLSPDLLVPQPATLEPLDQHIRSHTGYPDIIYQATLIPPANFAMVAPFVYRSSFPLKKNFPFLLKLGIKSILTLILEDYPVQNVKFLRENGIRLFQFGVPGNKEPFVDIPQDMIAAALATLLDRRNHPILIHCNKGKHRTGCLVGCLRRLQHWSLTAIFEEYRTFSAPKSRHMDQQFIELFNMAHVGPLIDTNHLPPWPTLL
ncbi:tyrosine-protein phosphatase siw14 [Tieghemiomyces parasiticus]|uniref:diphosphoinositol-polyphosphate diphosphatase n=1 Tax=Tieghemiomyces parasiticus TaxID=78921 RepID=A0A9W8AD72_9FUNG|nr:tyrosine-protein phosphatase siw14 [Tieghemiomyces parasiticus]